MSRFTAEEVQEAIDDSGIAVAERYSGRFMYGRECPSIEVDDVREVFLTVLEIALENEELGRWMAKSIKTDSMGKGIVAYWPSAEYPEKEAA